MPRILSPRLVALHSARPLTAAYYMNDLLYAPASTPVTWEFEEELDDPWLSMWLPERCLAIRRFDDCRATPAVKVVFTLYNGDADPQWELVPIPFSR